MRQIVSADAERAERRGRDGRLSGELHDGGDGCGCAAPLQQQPDDARRACESLREPFQVAHRLVVEREDGVQRPEAGPRGRRIRLHEGDHDPRGGGRSSARLTAPMVAAGAVAKKWLRQRHGTSFVGWMSALGEIEIPFEDEAQIALNPFFAPSAAIVPRLEEHMDTLRRAGDESPATLAANGRNSAAPWGRAGGSRRETSHGSGSSSSTQGQAKWIMRAP